MKFKKILRDELIERHTNLWKEKIISETDSEIILSASKIIINEKITKRLSEKFQMEIVWYEIAMDGNETCNARFQMDNLEILIEFLVYDNEVRFTAGILSQVEGSKKANELLNDISREMAREFVEHEKYRLKLTTGDLIFDKKSVEMELEDLGRLVFIQ